MLAGASGIVVRDSQSAATMLSPGVLPNRKGELVSLRCGGTPVAVRRWMIAGLLLGALCVAAIWIGLIMAHGL